MRHTCKKTNSLFLYNLKCLCLSTFLVNYASADYKVITSVGEPSLPKVTVTYEGQTSMTRSSWLWTHCKCAVYRAQPLIDHYYCMQVFKFWSKKAKKEWHGAHWFTHAGAVDYNGRSKNSSKPMKSCGQLKNADGKWVIESMMTPAIEASDDSERRDLLQILEMQ